MGKPFKFELENLPITYDWSVNVDVKEIASTIKTGSYLPLLSIGSGGSFSAAELQATLHRIFFNSLALATTPMELPLVFPGNGRATIWFMSASGNNIDIRRSFKHAILLEPRLISALVGRSGSKLADIGMQYEWVNIFEKKFPAGKDGFLATNSLLGFSIVLYRAYCMAAQRKIELPRTIDELMESCIDGKYNVSKFKELTAELWEKDTLHVIYSPGLKSLAIDIESKFVEAGLGAVLLADLRNFAHGRHHWFSKNSKNSGILCLSYADDEELGKKTLGLLPKNIPKSQFTLRKKNGQELLAGLVLSFYFTYWKGQERKIDPGKPGVPEYGSKIYRLTTNSGFHSSIPSKEAAIRRKIIHGPINSADLKKWETAYISFTKNISKKNIGALVLDYDGTLVDSRSRGNPPAPEICKEIVRLLDLGIKIGFATGRGQSIRKELQDSNFIPKKYWEKILIGYYNGSDIGTLKNEEKPISKDECVGELKKIEEILKENIQIQSLNPKITKRLNQITIEPEVAISETFLWETVQDRLSYEKNINIKVIRSSHSIDIVADFVTKLAMVEKMKTLIKNQEIILAIGDRGRWPGNDIELLSTPYSLSVDEVSSADDRCWNLCPAGIKGPQGALYYLKKIQPNNDKLTFI